MFDPRDLADLVALGQAGTLSAAAKRRGVAVSTVSRRIEALEIATGLSLVDRRADGVRLTAQGERLAALGVPLADQIARVSRAAEALRSGDTVIPVRISATELVVSDVLAPALPQLWADHPEIPVQLQSQAGLVSLAGRDADLAVRMSRPEGASLIGRRLPEIRSSFYAAPAYLAGRDPADIDLRRERLLGYDESYGRIPELEWLREQGLSGALALRTASTRAMITAAIAGAGIATLPVMFGAREPGLVEVPGPRGMPTRQPWLIVHRDIARLPSIRAVHRWIVRTMTRRILSSD